MINCCYWRTDFNLFFPIANCCMAHSLHRLQFFFLLVHLECNTYIKRSIKNIKNTLPYINLWIRFNLMCCFFLFPPELALNRVTLSFGLKWSMRWLLKNPLHWTSNSRRFAERKLTFLFLLFVICLSLSLSFLTVGWWMPQTMGE